jgi:hypothetical protein
LDDEQLWNSPAVLFKTNEPALRLAALKINRTHHKTRVAGKPVAYDLGLLIRQPKWIPRRFPWSPQRSSESLASGQHLFVFISK